MQFMKVQIFKYGICNAKFAIEDYLNKRQTFIEITFLRICKSLIKKGIVYHFKEVHKYLLSYLP